MWSLFTGDVDDEVSDVDDWMPWLVDEVSECWKLCEKTKGKKK